MKDETTKKRLEKLETSVDNLSGIVFDVRDNHLKHLKDGIETLTDEFSRLDEKVKIILWLVGATFGAIVLGILGTFLLKVCFNLAI